MFNYNDNYEEQRSIKANMKKQKCISFVSSLSFIDLAIIIIRLSI